MAAESMTMKKQNKKRDVGRPTEGLVDPQYFRTTLVMGAAIRARADALGQPLAEWLRRAAAAALKNSTPH
jgi:hypothetical protein